MTERSIDTELIHAGARHTGGAVVDPVYRSANFLQADPESYSAVRYQRLSNTPQHEALHDKLIAVTGAEDALTFTSGMGAVSTTLLALLSAGDHLLIQDNVYGGTQTLLEELARFGIEHTAIDATDPASWAAAKRDNTRVLYVESISNPLMQVAELDAAADFAHQHGLLSVVDNTFLSPIGYLPAATGFDLEVHSATKYLGGHCDIVAGVVAGRASVMDRVRGLSHHLGCSLDPDSAFLLDRGLKTLHVRVPRQCESALKLARALRDNPSVARVRYPGLDDDPGFARAQQQFKTAGAMLCFETRTDALAAAFFERLQIPLHAASLGGVESLVVRPSQSSHLGLSETERDALGISDRLIRVSVGLEDADELVRDFAQALKASQN